VKWLLAPLLFQERQGEVIKMFAFFPILFLAKQKRRKGNTDQNFQDGRSIYQIPDGERHQQGQKNLLLRTYYSLPPMLRQQLFSDI
jgi:hypothetical protein